MIVYNDTIDQQIQKNNSSFLTAENTSSVIHSNIKHSFNNKTHSIQSFKNIHNLKYLNSTIFFHPQKKKIFLSNRSNQTSFENTSKGKNQLYLTETKNEIIPTYQSKIKTKYLNLYRNKKNKKSLPSLKSFSHHKSNKFPEIFTCGDLIMKPKFLTKLYYQQKDSKEKTNKRKNINNDLNIIKSIDKKTKIHLKESTREYVHNSRQKNFLNYCIKTKNEALKEYEDNMKSQIKSLDYTISKINNYKINLENNYFIKYNEDKKEFGNEIYFIKQRSDFDKKRILSLLKEIALLSQKIIKKQAKKKTYEKWLSFQILLKEGSLPKKIKIKEYAQKKYGNKEIFEKFDDFLIIFKEKEDNNVRLMQKREKIIIENDKLQNELENLKKILKKNIIKDDIKLKEKEKTAKFLEIRNKDLNEIRNNLINSENKQEKKMKYSKSHKNYKPSFDNKTRDIDINKDLKPNPLGVYCYNLEKVKDIYKMINCIYISILKNKIKGLDISSDSIYKVNNTLSIIKKSILQLKIIEYSLNYLHDSINEKKKDKKYQQIIKETDEQIDLYYKSKKSKFYREERIKKMSEFMHKMEEKGKKVHFTPNKKYEEFPFNLYNKKKNNSINKNKIKKIDVFDYLYDELYI